MANAIIRNNLTVDGVTYTRSMTVTADGVVRIDKTGDNVLAAAKIGQLTTRTDNDTGTLTMDSGHGITTGNRLDLFWEENGVKGARYGMTVGTVSVNSVPIDLGAGDNLPTNLTAITAFVPIQEELLFTGNNAQFAFAKSTRRGIIVYTTSAPATVKAVVDELESDSGGGYQWVTGEGVTNPFAGVSVARVYFSNGDSSGTNSMVAGAGVSS